MLPPQPTGQQLVNQKLGKVPAPGASPVGGTTSLPQNLQTPQAGMTNKAGGMQSGGASLTNPMQPGGIGGGMPGGTGGTAGPVPASTPPGTVPPAPPPAGRTPPVGDPASTGQPPAPTPQTHAQQVEDASYKALMDSIANPSRYDEAGARTTGMHALQDEQTLAKDQARADAAKRGVYYGTPLTNSYGNIDDRYLRETGDLESKIAQDKAAHFAEDKQAAINNLFQYERLHQLSQQQQNELVMRMIEAGYLPPEAMNMGLPGIPGTTGSQ